MAVTGDDGYLAPIQSQQLGQVGGEGKVGLSLLRRGGHREPRPTVPFAQELRPGSPWNDLHRQQNRVVLDGDSQHADIVNYRLRIANCRLKIVPGLVKLVEATPIVVPIGNRQSAV